jgi:hypothetical protein
MSFSISFMTWVKFKVEMHWTGSSLSVNGRKKLTIPSLIPTYLRLSWISVVGGWKNIIFASVNSSSSGFAVLGLSVGFIMKTEPILILLIMLYYIFIYYYIYIKSFNS